MHEYAPWVIQRWNQVNLKPLSQEYKEKINWEKRYIESLPKLKPWKENIEESPLKNPNSHKDLEIIEDAIRKVIGEDYRVKKLGDIKEDLQKIQAYFRDLDS